MHSTLFHFHLKLNCISWRKSQKIRSWVEKLSINKIINRVTSRYPICCIGLSNFQSTWACDSGHFCIYVEVMKSYTFFEVFNKNGNMISDASYPTFKLALNIAKRDGIVLSRNQHFLAFWKIFRPLLQIQKAEKLNPMDKAILSA